MIVVADLAKSFGDVRALSGVSFEVAARESVVVAGPSGSGKTTLLRLIAGLELPDVGEIHIGGNLASSPRRAEAPHSRGIGFVFQRPALWPHLTVAQNILFGMDHSRSREARRRVSELLEATDLAGFEQRHPDQLSTGQARRVALVRAVAPRPRRLLMDEPLTNLDAESRRASLDLIRSSLEDTGASLLYVTHDMTEASEIAGRIVHLAGGNTDADTRPEGSVGSAGA